MNKRTLIGNVKGQDGKTPYIGENGNWWIGEVDTGVRAEVDSAHTQAASSITAGTFGGQVAANAAGQTPSAFVLRNSKIVLADENPTIEGEIVWVCK